MLAERHDFTAIASIPLARGSIGSSRDNSRPNWRIGDGEDRSFVTSKRVEMRASACIPNLAEPVLPGGNDFLAGRRIRSGVHFASIPIYREKLFAGGDLVDYRGPIRAAGQHP